MSIMVGDNFSYKGSKPLDARTKFATVAEMVATPVADLYDGCEAYVTATKKYYSYDSTNEVDETLGKWRERQSGGSGGGGHTIEDAEGTDLTQRDTLQFGDGLSAEDDDTNERSVVKVDAMPSADMEDVVNPLPMIPSRAFVVNKFSKGDLYSTDEKMIGKWTDGKPLYQKTIEISSVTRKSWNSTAHGISNIDKVVKYEGFLLKSNGAIQSLGTDDAEKIMGFASRTNVELWLDLDLSSAQGAIVTIQYTKTTDTSTVPISDGNDYSTDEQIVGTWINGKPLYQKTIVKNNFEVRQNASFAHGISNVDHIFIKEGHLTDNGDSCIVPLVWSDSYDGVYVNATNVVFKGTGVWGAETTRTIYLTVQYTKTTS